MSSTADSRLFAENTSICCLPEELLRVVFIKIKTVCFQASQTHYGTFCVYAALMTVSRDWCRIIGSMQLFTAVDQDLNGDGEDQCDGLSIETVSIGDDVITFAREIVASNPEAIFDEVDGEKQWQLDDPEGDFDELIVKAEINQSQTNPGHEVLFVVRELITTERKYIRKLRLINKDFRDAFNALNAQENLVPKQLVNTVFFNIDSIYRFHLQLLRELREPDDVSGCNIGQVFEYFAPFFKLYSSYFINVEPTVRLIKKLSRNEDFARMVEHFKNLPGNDRKNINDVLREPVFRVTKYGELLKGYLKKLPAASTDREPATRAIAAVHKAVNHVNEFLDKQDHDQRLANIAGHLSGLGDLVKPGRYWKRDSEEGPPVSVVYLNDNVQSVKHRVVYLCNVVDITQQDWFFEFVSSLRKKFNDVVLLREVGTKTVTDEIDMRSAKIKDLRQRQDSFAIRIITDHKVVELHFSNNDDKTTWYKEIRDTLDEYACARRSILRSHTALAQSVAFSRDELGIMNPVWVRDEECSQCAVCSSEFTLLMRRRHHCRACGCLVCGVCSRRRLLLAFLPYRPCRVCDNCFLILEHKVRRGMHIAEQTNEEQETSDLPLLDESLLTISNTPLYVGVKGTGLSLEQCYLSGSRDKVTWIRRWHSVHKNGIFYTFNDSMDSSAVSAMLLHEYQLHVSGGDLQSPANDDCYSFALRHRRNRQTFFYNAETREQFFGLCRSLCYFVQLLNDVDLCAVIPNSGPTVIDVVTDLLGSDE